MATCSLSLLSDPLELLFLFLLSVYRLSLQLGKSGLDLLHISSSGGREILEKIQRRVDVSKVNHEMNGGKSKNNDVRKLTGEVNMTMFHAAV